jgi:hypothetical protein
MRLAVIKELMISAVDKSAKATLLSEKKYYFMVNKLIDSRLFSSLARR